MSTPAKQYPPILPVYLDVGGQCPPDAERRLVMWCGPHPGARDGYVPGTCGQHMWFLIDPQDWRVCHCVVCGTARDCSWKMWGC